MILEVWNVTMQPTGNAGVWIVTFLPSSKVTPNGVTLHDILLHASC